MKVQTNGIIGKEIGKKAEIGKKIGKKEDIILKHISDNPNISISSLAQISGMATSTVQIYLDKLRKTEKIRRIGPDKGGHWELL